MVSVSPRYFVFGSGARRKYVYRAGQLTDALRRAPVRSWDVASEQIEPAEYRVRLRLKSGQEATIECDERGLWIAEEGRRGLVSQGALRLPRFEGRPFAPLLRILHHDILINIVDGLPLPNLLTHRQPSLRHAALMAMVLKETGNLDLLRPWIMGLRDPFNPVPGTTSAPDNLGQALYLVSLVADASHPLVKTALGAIQPFRRNHHVCGQTDGAEHPVYQTKWLKFGLRALGLDDPYVIPQEPDPYSSLFWMDFRDHHVEAPPMPEPARQLHPCQHWAQAHFHAWPPPAIPPADAYPITWDALDPAADPAGLELLGPEYVAQTLAAPHAGHAAEMFMYLYRNSPSDHQARS
jgi:hypothetical protein